MLQRFVDLEEAIKTTMALADEWWQSLSAEEWRLCRELCVVLKPFEQVTEAVSSDKYLTGSQILILTRGLMSALNRMLASTNDPEEEDFVETLHEITKYVISSLREETERRLGNLEASKTIGVSTMLDPRYKLQVYKNQVYASDVKKTVIDLITTNIRKKSPVQHNENMATSEPAPKIKKIDIWEEYNQILNKRPLGTPTSQAILEVQRYLEMPVLGRNEDPLEWWNASKHSFPNLAVLARQKLNFVATSVPCERLFSKAGYILNDRRTRLGIRKIQQLLFLNTNYCK